MEVAFTARNYLPGRRGLQYNDNRFTLMGSDGVEYKADGNFYGRSGAEKLNGTIWLEKDEQAAVTYIFPGVPPSVTATRLVVRDGDKVVGQFDVSATPTQRSAPPLAKPALGEPIAGQSVTLTQYQAGLVSLNPGGDGDWEGIMSFRNIATAPLKLWVGDIDVALRDAAGETRHNTGEFYFADRPGRQPNSNWMLVAVGAEVRVRLWFPHSAGLTPVQYAVREAGGEPKSMPIKFGPGGRLDLDGRVK
jgi:hypothetical protein